MAGHAVAEDRGLLVEKQIPLQAGLFNQEVAGLYWGIGKDRLVSIMELLPVSMREERDPSLSLHRCLLDPDPATDGDFITSEEVIWQLFCPFVKPTPCV